VPEIEHRLGSIISLLERHLIAKPFEIADSASLDGIMISLFKVGASKLLIRFFLLEDVIDNDQNTMGDRNERLLLANAFGSADDTVLPGRPNTYADDTRGKIVITQLYSQAKANKSSKTCMVAVRKQSACSFHLLKDGDRAVFSLL